MATVLLVGDNLQVRRSLALGLELAPELPVVIMSGGDQTRDLSLLEHFYI